MWDRIIAGLIAVLLGSLLSYADGINVQYSLKSKVVAFTVDISTTGAQAVTGVGFSPTACLVTGVIGTATSYIAMLGMADSAGGGGNTGLGTIGVGFDSADWFRAAEGPTAGNRMTASWTSWDADGFTFTKAKTGSPTGTVSYHAICFR